MTRALRALVIVLLATMLSGCVSPDVAAWGDDGIEVSVDESAMTATLSTNLGADTVDSAQVDLVGCDYNGSLPASSGSIAGHVSEEPVKLEGWLARSKHFPNGVDDVNDAEMMSAAAVIVDLGSYDNAEASGTGKLENVKWDYPYSAVSARPPTSTSSKNFPHSGWGVAGLVPANEEILHGFGGLDWHQKVSIEGWLMNSNEVGSYWYPPEVHVDTIAKNCRITSGMTDYGFSGAILVTSIKLEEHGFIDEQNPYDAYSVTFVGSWGYILLILMSLGGAVFLFLITTGLIRRGAKLTAKTLLTEAQILAAGGVQKEVSKMMREVEDQTGAKMDIKGSRKAEVVEADVMPKDSNLELDEFDITAALRSHRPDPRGVHSTTAKVVTTTEAEELDEQLTHMQEELAAQDEEVVQRRAPSSSSPSKLEVERTEPKVRKTRSVKKQEPEKKEPTKTGPDITSDDDFSDFSL